MNYIIIILSIYWSEGAWKPLERHTVSQRGRSVCVDRYPSSRTDSPDGQVLTRGGQAEKQGRASELAPQIPKVQSSTGLTPVPARRLKTRGSRMHRSHLKAQKHLRGNRGLGLGGMRGVASCE